MFVIVCDRVIQMICYLDRCFCANTNKCAKAEGCSRAITCEVVEGAKECGLPLDMAYITDCFVPKKVRDGKKS
jgi:hypothetical protein